MAAKTKELRVELTAGVKGFQKGFKEAEDIAEAWGDKLGSSLAMVATPVGLVSSSLTIVTAGLAAVVAGAAAVAAGLTYATKQTMEYADSLDTMAQRSGHSTDWLQEMRYAVGQTGTDMETLSAASTKLRNNLGEGSADTVKSLDALGLSLERLKKASPDEQMRTVLRAIGDVENPTTRTTLAINLLGKSGEALVPLARNAEELAEQARKLGVVMSEDDIAAAAGLKNEIRSLSDAFDGTVHSIGAAITSNESLHVAVSGLDEVFGTLTKAINGNREGMQSLVSGGVWLVVKGIQAVIFAIGEANGVASGLQIAWNRLNVAASGLAIGFSKVQRAKAVLSGDDYLAEAADAEIKALEKEREALRAHEGEIVAQGANRKEAIEETKRQLKDLEKAISESFGKQIKAKPLERGPGTDPNLIGSASQAAMDKAAREAERLAEKTRRFAAEIDTAFAQAGARGMPGIEGAFAKIEADATRFQAKLKELVRDGLDADAAAAFADEIDGVTAALKDAAFEAERMSVLGATFRDLEREGANLRDVLLHTDIQTLTDEALLNTERQLRSMRDAGVAVEDSERSVRDEIHRRKIVGEEVEKQSNRFHYKLEADQESERIREEATIERWDRMLDKFSTAEDILGGLGDLVGSIGLGDLGDKIGGVADWAGDLGAALSDGMLSWGEIGSLAASAIEGIKNTFSTPKWEKLANGIGKKWGVQITDELAKEIEADADRLGDNVAAQLKALPKIIEEAGGINAFGFEKAAAGAHDLFSMIETGKLSVQEAGEAFDEVFGQLLPEALDKTTGLAKDSFLELIKLDQRFGTNSKQVKAFMEGQTSALMKGLEALAKGGKITEKSAAGVASSIVVAYKTLRDQGVSARDALTQMQPSIDDLREKLQELGVGGGEAFDILAQQSELYADKTAGPLLEAINGAGEALTALFNMGALTQESFEGLTASIGDTYAELVATGQAGPAAMQAIAPDLQRVWELQQRTGFAVDAATQALLDEAVAAGLVGEAHVSAQDKMAASAERLNVILEAIAKSMGIDIPAAAQQAADGVNAAFDGINPPDLTGSYSYTGTGVPTEPLPSFATGGIGDFGSGAAAMLHGREWIVPDQKMRGLLGRGDAKVYVNVSSMIDPSQNYESERRQNERVSEITAVKVSRSLSRAMSLDLA